MNTKERLKEQRQAGWRAGRPMVIGMAIGFAIGFGMSALSAKSSMTPEWAFYLIAYGLGMVSVFIVWWLRGYEVPPTRKKESV